MIIEFNGLTERLAKRRALNYWYQHRGELDLSVAEFFARCRVKRASGIARITYYPGSGPGTDAAQAA